MEREAERVEDEAAVDWVAEVVLLLPDRAATVCARNAATRNLIK